MKSQSLKLMQTLRKILFPPSSAQTIEFAIDYCRLQRLRVAKKS